MDGFNLIGGENVAGLGAELVSTNPATGDVFWSGREASQPQTIAAIAAARRAQHEWASRPAAARAEVCRAYASVLRDHRHDLAGLISRETGKPDWEAEQEVDTMVNKVELSIEAEASRRVTTSRPVPGAVGITRYKPHGVMAVVGPFNFPGHLPNGHITPALLAGNAVVFKPSELAPATGQMAGQMWQRAGLPAGLLAVLHGGRTVGEALVDGGIDGVAFTGSFHAGQAIARRLADDPARIVALEMGGNNALVVWPPVDTAAAAYAVVTSAFATAGQRCSCARRLVLPAGHAGDAILERVVAITRELRVGHHADRPQPFMGPVISDAAASRLLAAQADLVARGARVLLPMQPVGTRTAMLRPGLLDVTGVQTADEELFGPLLLVRRVGTFEEAVAEANQTRYGLASGLLCDDADRWHAFYAAARAGVVNWNRPLTGASSALPFGGTGRSGNHRPSAFFAADYCSYPVASLECERLALPTTLTPGIVL